MVRPSACVTAMMLCLLGATPADAAEQRATMLHTAAAQATSGEPLQIDGSLAPGNETIKKVVLRFRGTGEEYQDAVMEIQYGDLYRGIIPGKAVRHPAVEYFIEGTTADGQRLALFMTAGKPARVAVGKDDMDPADSPYAQKDPPPEKTPEKTPVVEKTPEAEKKLPPCPKKKATKKTKKGKKEKEEPCEDVPAETEVAAAEPVKEPVKEKEPPPEKEPVREEPRKDKDREREREAPPETPTEKPRKLTAREKSEREATRKSERDQRRKEMEEEMKVYAAEDSAAARVRNDKEATRDPRLTQIITARQLKQMGARTVMDAIDLTQGLTVSRSITGFYRTAVRGIRDDASVLWLYDGHRMNDLYDGKAITNLPVETLERIEVTRGPQGLLTGTGAALVTINLVPNREVGIRAQFSGGSYNKAFSAPRSPVGFDGSLSAAGEFGPVKLGLDGAVWGHGGYVEPIQRDALDTDTIRQAKREPGLPAGWTNDQNLRVNIGAGGELNLDAVGKLWLKGRFLLENRAGLVGLFDAVGEDSKLAWTQVLIDLGWQKKLTDTVTLKASGWFDQRNSKRTWQLSPKDYDTNFTAFNPSSSTFFPEGIIEEVRVGERTFGVQVEGHIALPFNNALVAGLSYEYRGIHDYAYSTNYDSLPVTTYRGPSLQTWHDASGNEQTILISAARPAGNRSAIGIFVGDTWRPIEALAIDVGLRVDLTQLPVGSGAASFSGSTFSPFFGPRVAISFAATPGLLLKLSYGRMLRTPTVQEYAETLPNSVPNQGRFVGNPSLKPSTTDTVEAGLDWMQGFGDARLKLRGSAFFTSISDAIHPVDPSGNLVPYANRTSGVFVFGADGEARLDVGRMGAFVNASWFRALDNGTPESAQLITDVPQVRLNSGISVPLGPFLAFDVNFKYGAERRNNQRSTLELLRRYTLPAYAIVGAQLRTEPLFDHVELSLGASNVFNFALYDDAPRMDATRVPNGVPREGWGVFGTIRGWY